MVSKMSVLGKSQQPVRCDCPPPAWHRLGSLAALAASVACVVLSLAVTYGSRFASAFLLVLVTILGCVIFLTAYALWRVRMEHRRADLAFRDAACEFTSIFQNVLDGILILDDRGRCLDGNPAAATILRFSRHELIGQDVGRFFTDPAAFALKWSALLGSKNQRGRAQLVAGDGTTLYVDFTASANYLPGRHVFVLCDVTDRTRAQMQISEHLCAAEAARAEAEALRKCTLALSQNLAMDSVLDALLECISQLVPFDTASVLFAEGGSGLMVAREAPRTQPKRVGLMLDATKSVFLQKVFLEHGTLLVRDTADESGWNNILALGPTRSWLGVPLVVAGRVLGVLSLGASAAAVFTAEHLRLAKSLAIPAAVAIQNARTHERAEIYAAELEVRLQELHETRKLWHT